jgi:hypothetical protein
MTYNGHKNYNYWNVSLWLHNEENLYRQVETALTAHGDKDKAARLLLGLLPLTTPDGVAYTFRNVRAALKD